MEYVGSRETIAGHRPKLLICGGGLSSCYKNPTGDKAVCFSCRLGTNRLIRRFRIEESFDVITLFSVLRSQNAPSFKNDCFGNPASLKSISYCGVPIGEGVASAVVSSRRDHLTEFTTYERKHLVKNLQDAARVVDAGLKLFGGESNIDELVVYNGRNFCSRGLLEVAWRYDVPTVVTENGGRGQESLITFKNSLPHGIEENTRKAFKLWNEQPDLKLKESIGAEFYIKNAEGRNPVGKSYSSSIGSICRPDRKNVVAIFTSSDDELFAVGRDWGGTVSSQIDGLKKVLSVLGNLSSSYVFVRAHPNLKAVPSQITAEFEELCESFSNVEYISPKSDVSSYQLVRIVDKVITFGSTIGIEATFFRKPSMALRDPIYRRFDACYLGHRMPIHEFEHWLLHSPEPKPVSGALVYGYYRMQDGRQMIGSCLTKYRGKKIPAPVLSKPIWSVIFGRFRRLKMTIKRLCLLLNG